MTCRTCKWLNVEPNKAGRRVARKDITYPCTVPIEKPRLPDSVRQYARHWPPPRSYMGPNDGQDCPCYASEDTNG